MINLKEYKLKELFHIEQGYAFKSEKYLENGKYRLCTLGNISEDNSFKFNDSKAKYYPEDFPKEFILNEGDLIIPLTEQTYGLFGNTAIIPKTKNFKFVLNQRVGKIVENKELVDKLYLHHLLATDIIKTQIESTATGTTQRNISPDKIADLKAFLPDLPTQKKIADVLSCIDEKIAINNKTNTELENMAKTIYDYWFTQFDFPDKNGHPYKTSGGQMVYNETLKRDIPAGWEVRNILECCKVIDCLHSKKPDYCFEDENCYLLQLENLIDLKLIDLSNKYYVSKKDYEIWTSKTKVKQGDLVVTNAGRVGGVSRIPNYIETGIGRNMTSIRPISISEYLLCYFFSSSDCDKQIRQNTDQGAFFQSLNVKGIKKLNLTIPPKAIQDKFDSLVGKIRLQIESNHKENEELTKLRDYLLPLLMNGQVNIKE